MKLITNLADYLLDPQNIETLLSAALDIILALGSGLIKSAGSIAAGIAELTSTMVENLFKTDWRQEGANLFSKFWEGLKSIWPELESWLTTVGDSILAAFTSVIEEVKSYFTGEDPTVDTPTAGGIYRPSYTSGFKWGVNSTAEDRANVYKEMYPELYNDFLYTADNGQVKFDEVGFNQQLQINLQLDGETIASALYDPMTKLGQQKGAPYR